jgi:hypothetical protein
MSGYGEPSLVNWSAVSLPSIPVCPGNNISWTLLCSASFTRDWWQSQTSLEFIWKLLSSLMADLTIRENIPVYVSTFVARFHILHYACLDDHISVWNTVVWSPRLKLCPFLESHLYTQHHRPHWFWTCLYSRPGLFIVWFNLFCHSCLLGIWTLNGILYAYRFYFTHPYK